MGPSARLFVFSGQLAVLAFFFFSGNGKVIFFFQASDWEIKLGLINVLPLQVNVCDRFAASMPLR